MNLPNELAIGVADSNHVTMCKFTNTAPQKYEPVWKAVRKLAKEAVIESNART